MSKDERQWSRRDVLARWRSGAPPAPAEAHRDRDFFVGDEREADAETHGGTDLAPFESTEPSRRAFVKTVGVAAAAVAVVKTGALAAPANRALVVAAIGDVLIPSDPGDPGYRDLETFKITEEVLKALPGVEEPEVTLWNDTPKKKFGGKTFLELNAEQRGQYMRSIVDGTAADEPTVQRLRRVYRNTRRRILTLYYSNYPEHQWPRDSNGMPILKPGDQHQITNPNTVQLITGWDQSRFHGPLTWEEEERRRNLMKPIHWHEGWSPFDYVPEPAALRSRKQS